MRKLILAATAATFLATAADAAVQWHFTSPALGGIDLTFLTEFLPGGDTPPAVVRDDVGYSCTIVGGTCDQVRLGVVGMTTEIFVDYETSDSDGGSHGFAFPAGFARSFGTFAGIDAGSSVTLAPVSNPPGGIPEPSAWALMIAGFGLAGAALRRRRAAVA